MGGLLLWLIGWFLVVNFCLPDLVFIVGCSVCYLTSLVLRLDFDGGVTCFYVVIFGL